MDANKCVCYDKWPSGGWRRCPYCNRRREKFDGDNIDKDNKRNNDWRRR